MTKNKGGRPAHHDGEIKKAAIAVRTAPSVRDALKVAADEAGRSVTQEVEARLAASLERDAGGRSPETERLLNRIAAEIVEIETITKKRWHRDRKTAGAVMEMLEKKARYWVNTDDPFDDELVNEAWQRLDLLRQQRAMAREALQAFGITAAESAFKRSPSSIVLAGTAWGKAIENAIGSVSGRWNERHQLGGLDLPEPVKTAAEALIEQMEGLDTEIEKAEAQYSDALAPYHSAELEGRGLYIDSRKRVFEAAVRRGERPDLGDLMLT